MFYRSSKIVVFISRILLNLDDLKSLMSDNKETKHIGLTRYQKCVCFVCVW